MKHLRKRNRITCSAILRIPNSCWTSSFLRFFLFAAFLLPQLPAAEAQQPVPWRNGAWNESFASLPSSPYALGSDTRIDTARGYVLLTPEEAARSGRIFLTALKSIDNFDVSFRAWFGRESGANGSGADGIVFVFAPIYNFQESGGATLNFDGCLGYGIEFDTYENPERNDRSPEHVAVIKDNSDNHLISEVLSPGTLEDERWHVLRIRFRAGIVEVFIDGTRRLNTTITDFYPFEGYFGFTSATGFAFNEHRLDDVALSLPNRLRMDFGAISLCRPTTIDTAIIIENNHPDGGELIITSVTLASATPGVFTIPSNPSPATVAPGGLLKIPLRIDVATGGSYSAILKIEAANGETVYDTLLIAGEEPLLEWRPSQVMFPTTWGGDTSEVTAALVNTGRSAVQITGTIWKYSGRSVFTAAAPLPTLLAPGDSLPVRFQFAPRGIIDYWDSLLVITDCGQQAALYVRGLGQNERLFFSLKTPLLISPGHIGELLIRLDSVPRNSSFERIDFDMTIDPAFSTLIRLEKITPVLSSSAIISMPTSIGNLLRFSITEPGGLRDTGAIIAVKLLAAAPGPECRDVRLEWQTYNPYGLNGHTQGEICINPSCRLPEGLHKAAVPQMTVTPLPVRDQLTVLLSSESLLFTTVYLLDAQGRRIQTVYEGMLDRGTAIRQMSAARLPSGHYYLFLRCPFGERITPVIIEK